jgi:uncharacterized glyoxalase superfamily protein PhnB
MKKIIMIVSICAIILLFTLFVSNSFVQTNCIDGSSENMTIKKLTPNLMVEDVNKAINFYKETLGFEFVMGVPKDSKEVLMEMPEGRELIYSLMKLGNIEVMFQAKESLSEDIPVFKDVKIGSSSTLYFEVDNVEELYNQLKDKVIVVKELSTTWYGMQEFYIQDVDGYILGFAQQKQG